MTDSLFQEIKETLLEPHGLNLNAIEGVLGNVLGGALNSRVDFADFYFQHEISESWSLEGGLVKSGSFSLDQGVGVRVIEGEKTGFAYADSLDLEALKIASKAASGISMSYKDHKNLENKNKNKNKIKNNFLKKSLDLNNFKNLYSPLYQPHNPINSLASDQKVDLLKNIDAYARSKDSRIKEVMASLLGTYEMVLIMASDGTLAYDIRPLVRLNITVVAESGSHREQGFSGAGGRKNYSMFLESSPENQERQSHKNTWKTLVDEACDVALTNLGAVEAPAGEMDVVLGSGWPGVLLHEAFGHGLEGDFNRKGTSTFHDLMGQKVASDLCTIVDDGTVKDARGSLAIDDEGTPTQRTVLVEKGVLKNYMQDKHNASLMGVKSTGNGRRESYAHLVMPRMTNTYLLPGEHSPEEIIGSVKNGLYAKNFSGGAVDITSGKFVFVANEAFLIQNGKITHPVKGATLIGDGPSALLKVSMLGNDLKLDPGIGVCGKDGQSVPVGVGQPTLRINGLTVGGTGALEDIEED